MKKWTWRIVIVVLAILLLVAFWACWMMVVGGSASEAPQTPAATKGQVSKGEVTKTPTECTCHQKPIPKKKAKRHIGKNRPLVHAKPKPTLVPAPVAQAQLPAPPVVLASSPAPAPVVAKVDKGMLDNVDINFAKRAKAIPPQEETVIVVSKAVVIEKPAKFYPAVPSNYNTCQFLYGSYRCDNPSYGYTRGTSYVQPYAPQPHQPVVVQRNVSPPTIRTSPTAAPVITTAPQSIATR